MSKGAIAPVLIHFGSRTTLAGGTLMNNRAMLEAWIADPERLKLGARMPSLALRPEQLQPMAEYLESLK